jgi:hypothetical protein
MRGGCILENVINNTGDINIPPVNKVGRPTMYKPEYNKQAYKLCLLGATDKELADYFEVEESTVNNWKALHTEFMDSLKSGREEADANIAKSLYHRAKGYSHKEDVIMQFQGQPVIVPTIKHYPPDTAAAFIWLKNRRGDKWMDKAVVDINQSITLSIGEIPDLDTISARLEALKLKNVTPAIEAGTEDT